MSQVKQRSAPPPATPAVERTRTTIVRRGAAPQRSPVATYLGIALAAIGFLAIGLAWNFAAELDYIPGQFPYFISGSLTGIGLIVVGATIMVIETMQRDALQRHAELQRLTTTLARLHGQLSPPDPFDPAVTGEFRPKPRAEGNGQSEAPTEQLPTVGDASWDAGA